MGTKGNLRYCIKSFEDVGEVRLRSTMGYQVANLVLLSVWKA